MEDYLIVLLATLTFSVPLAINCKEYNRGRDLNYKRKTIKSAILLTIIVALVLAFDMWIFNRVNFSLFTLMCLGEIILLIVV